MKHIPLLVKGGVAARFNKMPRSIISRAQTGWSGLSNFNAPYLIVPQNFYCYSFGFELYFSHLNLSGGYSEPMNGNPKLHLAYYAAADSRRQGERVSIRF